VRFGPRTAGVSIQYKGKGAPSDKRPVAAPRVRPPGPVGDAGVHAAQGWWERAEAEGTPLAKVRHAEVLRDGRREVNRLGL
jgi:hypothetical protein